MNRSSLLAALVVGLGACGVSQSGGPGGAAGTTGSAGATGAAGSTSAAGTTGAAGDTSAAAGTTGTAGSTSAAGATGSTAGATGTGTSTGGSSGAGTSGAAGVGGATSTGGAGGQPLSGVTVTIAGNVVPKEKVIVFLHVGHSNMAGRAFDPVALHDFNFVTSPRLYSYAKGGVWKPAVEPLSPDATTMGKAGPGMSILRAALAVAPADAYVVSIGHGESGTTGGYCRNFRKGGVFYNQAMAPALELKGKVTFGGIWMMFGTAEFTDMSHATTFGQCLTGVVNDMRADLGLPNLPAVIGDWEMGASGKFLPTTDFAKSIIAQIHSTVTAVPPAVLIPTDGLVIQDPDPAAGTDGPHHYNYTGHKVWAERGINLLKTANLTPWAAP